MFPSIIRIYIYIYSCVLFAECRRRAKLMPTGPEPASSAPIGLAKGSRVSKCGVCLKLGSSSIIHPILFKIPNLQHAECMIIVALRAIAKSLSRPSAEPWPLASPNYACVDCTGGVGEADELTPSALSAKGGVTSDAIKHVVLQPIKPSGILDMTPCGYHQRGLQSEGGAVDGGSS